MESELKDLKSVLRSIVVSSPAQVDVRSLQRDYRNMMGVPIPLAKYGYKDVLVFLKERCSDCFLFQGHPSNPVLTLIVPETLKHIDQFVRKQKTSGVAKMKGKRRSVPESITKPHISHGTSNLISETFNRNNVPTKQLIYNQPNNIQPVVKPPDIKREQLNNNDYIPTNKIYNSTKNLTDYTKSTSQPRTVTENQNTKSLTTVNENQNPNSSTMGYKNQNPNSSTTLNENQNPNSCLVENGQNRSVRDFLKKRISMYESSQYVDSDVCSEPDKASSKGDTDSGRQTSSSHSSTKRAQLEELKCEIHELIKEHEEGIWCTDLMRLYRERYERELPFDRYGHNNINSLLRSMQERISFCAEGGSLRLRDAPPRQPRPAPPRPPRPLPRPRPPQHFASHAALPVDPDDALPGIDFEPDVFPPDCMHYMESIPALSLADVQPGAMLEVTVGEVYSPSHFWLQRLGDNYNLAMEQVMDEMSQYYNVGEGKSRTLARGAVRPGHYCSSVYDNDWHRSLIIKILDADTVKVRHVDYGTVDTVCAAWLRPLPRAWGALPAQAVRARLAGLRPGAGGRRWPHAAAAHFLALVRDKQLVANVVAVDAEEDTIETFLIDTSGEDDVCITSEMIRSGHADARQDSALRAAEYYLYPRFNALEIGDTPNFAEIHRYLADGISLEYVDSYRRHVPAVLPVSVSPPPSPSPPLSPPPSPPPELFNRVPLLRLDSPPPPSSESHSSQPSPSVTPVLEPPAPIAASAPTTPSPSPTVTSTTSPPVSTVTLTTSPPVSTVTLTSSPPVSTLTTTSTISTRTPVTTTNMPPLISKARPLRYPPAAAPRPPMYHKQRYSAPPPPQYGAPPPPQYGSPRPPQYGAGEVRLSSQECEMYTLLSSLDANAAHCYMVSALRRAAAAQVPRPPAPRPAPAPPAAHTLNPHAPEFRFAYPPAYGVSAPPPYPPPPFARPPPPPGF